MEKRNKIFEEYPIPKAVWSLALPTMMGMLITIIYNLADTFFVGKLNDVNQVAAVSISMPIFMFLMAIGTIFGVGGATYISRMLGLKKFKEVKNASSFSFYTGIFLGIIYIIAGTLFMSKILKMAGASELTYNYAESYLKYIVWGAPVIILGFSLGQLARAEGAAKEAMVGMMLGTIINIILDPILILWAGMGVAGAAIATVIANFISVGYYCYFFTKKNSLISLSIREFSLNRDMLKSILSIGLPASLNSVLMSVSTIILNNAAAGYGDNIVAALGIVSRINMLPVLLIIGLAQGIQPLIGYNYASGNHERMKKIMTYTVINGTIIGVFFTVLLYFNSYNAVKIFINQDSVVQVGAAFERVNIISIPFLAVMFVIMVSFQAFGKAVPSLILSISRQGLIFMPLIVIFNKAFGLDGIVYAQPIADFISTLLGIYLMVRMFRKNKTNQGIYV